MAALCNRAGHYIFALWFLLFVLKRDVKLQLTNYGFFYIFYLFFSSPNLSRRRQDVYRTSTHGAALVRI